MVMIAGISVAEMAVIINARRVGSKAVLLMVLSRTARQ